MRKVSIVTITYNSHKTVRDTFDSMLKQNYRPMQYIVVDGLSNDGTIDIVKEYQKKFEDCGIEFQYISEKDKGISDAFNKGIRMADGELIGIINSDDMLCDEALNTVMASYKDEIGVYYGQCVVFNDNNDEQYLVSPKTDLTILEKAMPIYHPSTFVQKKVYEEYGVFKTDLKYCMDRELLLRFYKKGVIFQYIPKPLAFYREGGVNQVNYKANLEEGTKVAVQYGMNPIKARILKYYKYFRYIVWKGIQQSGLERFFHKKI